jgi:hypothetical protein
MTHYFFDVIEPEGKALDFVGRTLPTADEAYNAAELMAFDLAVSQAENVVGTSVIVCDAQGRELFSVPVKQSYLSATWDHDTTVTTFQSSDPNDTRDQSENSRLRALRLKA